MTDLLAIPAFLRRPLQPKGATVTEQKPKCTPREKKAVLRLVVEYAHGGDIRAAAGEVVAKAKEGNGTVRSAKLTGLPTSTDLA